MQLIASKSFSYFQYSTKSAALDHCFYTYNSERTQKLVFHYPCHAKLRWEYAGRAREVPKGRSAVRADAALSTPSFSQQPTTLLFGNVCDDPFKSAPQRHASINSDFDRGHNSNAAEGHYIKVHTHIHICVFGYLWVYVGAAVRAYSTLQERGIEICACVCIALAAFDL